MTKELRRQPPKMDEVVCAHNFFSRKGTKPILQATVSRFLDQGSQPHYGGL